MVDLTTLEGADTPGKVRALCAKAMRPDPSDPTCPSAAAVCVYPDLVGRRQAVARRQRRPRRRRRHRLPVAAAPPSTSSSPTPRDAVEAGADEIDMVIDRGAFLAGRYLAGLRRDRRRARGVRRPDGASAHLKVIFETGELQTYDNVRRASWLAMLAGADFIKTSTGKVQPAATLPVTLVMLEAVRDFRAATGRHGRGEARRRHPHRKDAIRYLVHGQRDRRRRLARPRLVPVRRLLLLNDLLMQRPR